MTYLSNSSSASNETEIAMPYLRTNEIDRNQERPSKLWRGLKIVLLFFCETALRIAAFVILCVVVHFFYPLLAPPLFAIAIAAFASRVVVRLMDAYDFRLLMNFKQEVSNFV